MRVYPITSPYNSTGMPWGGPRSTPTGTPLTGGAQVSTLTVTGTASGPIAKEYHSTLACSPGNGDVVTLTMGGGGPYGVTVSGYVKDVWDVTVTNTTDDGNAAITIEGVPYVYTVLVTDTDDDVAVALAGLINAGGGDPYYVATAPGAGVVHLLAQVYGVSATTVTDTGTTGSTTVTPVHTTPGADGQSQQDIIDTLVSDAGTNTLWTVTDLGGGVIDSVHTIAGVTANTVSSTYTPALGTGTFGSAKIQEGVAANTVAVSDGTHNYSYTIADGDGDSQAATGLAAAIDGNDGYAATATDTVVFVSGTVAVPFTMTDTSINTQMPGDVIAYGLISSAIGAATTSSSSVLTASSIGVASIFCKLVSGTSCVVTPWVLEAISGTWVALADTTVDHNKLIQIDMTALQFLFVEQKDYVGVGVVLVSCVGNSTSIGNRS